MLDEGMAVLYNTISNMLEQDTLEENEEYEALIIDCGGGTTDLCSYRFRIQDRRAAYKIYMETTYENGDTDFGGNNIENRTGAGNWKSECKQCERNPGIHGYGYLPFY